MADEYTPSALPSTSADVDEDPRARGADIVTPLAGDDIRAELGCCGKCPPLARGGYDCTCMGNPRCEKFRVEVLTPEQIRTRRAEVLAALGGDEERIRDRAARWLLDAEERALFTELENLDWLAGGE